MAKSRKSSGRRSRKRSDSSKQTVRRRFAANSVAAVDALIRQTAENLLVKKDDKGEFLFRENGPRNEDIVQSALAEAETLLKREFGAAIAAYLAMRVPLVLAEPPEPGAFQPLLAGLQLPAWFAVPPEGKGKPGWKPQADLTPNQIQRIIDHRSKDIDGRIEEKNKLVLLRATALDEGCDPNKPISSVLLPPKSGGDGPTDHPPQPSP